MRRVRSLTPRNVLKILQKERFVIDHTTGSHYILYHPETERRVSLAYHAKDLPKGTLHSILKAAGIEKKSS